MNHRNAAFCVWYVIATGESHSVREFAQLAFAEVGLDWEDYVTVDDRFKRPAGVSELRGGPTKARATLGWAPETSFSELVRIMVAADMDSCSKERS